MSLDVVINKKLSSVVKTFSIKGKKYSVPTIEHSTIRVTPEKFISMKNQDEKSVKNAKFIPPQIGSGSLGSFEIELNALDDLINEI